MTTKSRLNPSKTSRPTLRRLQDKGILNRMKVGLRHLIKTDGTVEALGFDIGSRPVDSLENFYPGTAQAYGTVVEYDGGRAELTATIGRTAYRGHVLDVSAHFARNQLATDLLSSKDEPWATGPHDKTIAYGNAILVTDNRMHWYLRRHGAEAGEVAVFDNMLTSPRTLFENDYGHDWIFFHETPSETDLIALMLRWA